MRSIYLKLAIVYERQTDDGPIFFISNMVTLQAYMYMLSHYEGHLTLMPVALTITAD